MSWIIPDIVAGQGVEGGLKSDTEYKFHVSARTTAGSGPAATVLGRTNKEGEGCTKQTCTVIIVVAYQNI